MSRWRRPAPYTAPTESKAAGLYMICTLSKQQAEGRGYNDALMLDWRGRVAEATGANIFFVTDGALHTPTPDCFLDGITRRTVMDLARKRGIEVVERPIWPEEMEASNNVPDRNRGRGHAGAIDRPLEVRDRGTRASARKDYEDLVNGRIPNA